ncbi:MAG TPA: hypothetical protein VNM24_00310 [Burkholderiales bacterium]|jgi:hypothetical protein|nr:hypothetical protein [Burkholderiales bacterium]
MFRTLMSCLLLAVLSLGLPARAQEQVATIRDQNGCQIYNPNPQREETVRWSGGCANGFAEGEGVLEWYVGGRLEERYEGSMRAGWAEGIGTFTSRQGFRYKGEWKRSQQDGQGVSQSPDGSVYDGQWRAGKPHGWGIYRTPDGQTVEGEWENGEIKSGSSSRRI